MSPAQPSPGAVKALIRATFNAAAKYFDDAPLFFWDHCGTRTVELAGVAPGNRVLDVCCGTGASALPAAQRVGPTGRVVGVDLAEQLLVRARAKARERGLDNVEFTEGDMTRLDVADNSMDVVVCVLGLYFAQDQPSAVAELWRVVRPGGTLAVTTWGRRALEPANTMYLEAVAAERPDLDARSRHNLGGPCRASGTDQGLSGGGGVIANDSPRDPRLSVECGRLLDGRAWIGLSASGRRHGP